MNRAAIIGAALVGLLLVAAVWAKSNAIPADALSANRESYVSVLSWAGVPVVEDQVGIDAITTPVNYGACPRMAISKIATWVSANPGMATGKEPYIIAWGLMSVPPIAQTGNPIGAALPEEIIVLDELQATMQDYFLPDGHIFYNRQWDFNPPFLYTRPKIYAFFDHQADPQPTGAASWARWWIYYRCVD